MDSTTVGTIAEVVVAFFGVIIAITAWLANRYLGSIERKLGSASSSLSQIQIDLGVMGNTIKHHSETQDEFCSRLKAVEVSVNNTERLAVVERDFSTLKEEVNKNMRPHIHDIAGVVQGLQAKMEVFMRENGIKKPAPAI